MDLARAYLRPDNAEHVTLIEADGGEAELKLQLRGYLSGGEDDNTPSATDAVAAHLFEHLRGSDNLVFAGARQRVEIYADRLRNLCEQEHLPQEFYPHHASLSRDHRDFVERRLKDNSKPTTAVCTSTLELGHRHRRCDLCGANRRTLHCRSPAAAIGTFRTQGGPASHPATIRGRNEAHFG